MQDGLRGVDAATLAAIHRSLEEERSAAGITTPQMAHVVPTRTVPVFGYPPDPHPRFGSQPPPYGP